MASLKGRLTAEVHFLFERMKAFGVSKRELKMKAIDEGKPFYHYYCGRIFSLSAFESYKPRTKRFVHWCADRFQIAHISQIKHGMFREYVDEVLVVLKPNAVKVNLAAIVKLGEGLGKAESFHRISRQIQKQLPRVDASRPSYLSQEQVLKVLELVEQSEPRYGLAMRVQLETACRLCELERLRAEDLLGVVEREGHRVGLIKLRGKGGRLRNVEVCEKTYQQLQEAFSQNRKLIFYDGFRAAVYRASERMGLQTGGTHKARRFSIREYAKSIYRQSLSSGLSQRDARRDALEEANRRLGHSPERKSTTRLYLGK